MLSYLVYGEEAKFIGLVGSTTQLDRDQNCDRNTAAIIDVANKIGVAKTLGGSDSSPEGALLFVAALIE